MTQLLDLSKFQKGLRLAKKSSSNVYKILEKKTGNIFSANISQENFFDNSNEKNTLFSQNFNTISKMRHPSLVRLIGYSLTDFDKQNKPVFITEYSANGQLSKLTELNRQRKDIQGWDDTKKLINIYSIASGMSYLHSNNIYHQNLNSENIQMDDFLLPKITNLDISKSSEDEQNTKADDVYSFSNIVYEILTSEKPILNEIPDFIPQAYRELIERCRSPHPNERPTFDQIVSQLRSDPGFITENVDKNDYYNFIDFLENYQDDSNIGKLFKSNSQRFQKVLLNTDSLDIEIGRAHV